MVNETHSSGFQSWEMQREQREVSSAHTITIPYQESSSIIISFSPEWGQSNLPLQNVHGTQGANRLGLPPSVMLSNKKGVNPMAQRISPGTELHSGVAAREEMGQRDYRLRALANAGITVEQTEDATLVHISRIPPNQWVQVNGQKYYGPMGSDSRTETTYQARSRSLRFERGRQAEGQIPEGGQEVASVLGEDPAALAERVNIEERSRMTEARRNELRHLALLQETEQTWYDDFVALVRKDGKVFESAIPKYVHDRNEVLHRDGLHMGVAFGRVKLAPWEGARGRGGLRGVPVTPMPQPEGAFTLEQLEPQLVQEIQLLPVEFQRPVVLLAERMEVRERSVLIVLLEKLVHIGIGTFLSLPIFTPEGRLKKPGEGDMPAAVKQFLESLSPEERDILERVAAICLDLRGVGALASRPGRTESYPLDEENPALKAKILAMAKRFTEAKTEEDRLIAEGSLRMAGVDVDGSDLRGGRLTMLPTTGGARFINLVVGLIQMGVGIFRKLGGKKTTIEKEQGELQLPENPKDPKEMTSKEREDELKKDRGAVAESLEKEKKLRGDVTELETKLQDDKLEQKTREALTKRLGEVKKELSDLQAARAKMERRIRSLEEAEKAPVSESAESVSEKMTKFKARLAKYKETIAESEKLREQETEIRMQHPMSREKWDRLINNPELLRTTLAEWGFSLASQDRQRELRDNGDLSLVKLDQDFDKLSSSEKEFAKKNLIPDFLKEVNAIIKPNIELVFHDDIFAIKGPDGTEATGFIGNLGQAEPPSTEKPEPTEPSPTVPPRPETPAPTTPPKPETTAPTAV